MRGWRVGGAVSVRRDAAYTRSLWTNNQTSFSVRETTGGRAGEFPVIHQFSRFHSLTPWVKTASVEVAAVAAVAVTVIVGGNSRLSVLLFPRENKQHSV